MSRMIRIAGYRLKDGKLVREGRRLSVSDRLRRAGGKRIRVARPGAHRAGEMKGADPPRRVDGVIVRQTGIAPKSYPDTGADQQRS